MPRDFLFDIGNVILFFDFRKAMAKIASQCLVDPETGLQMVFRMTEDLETGRISPEEFISAAIEAIRYEGEPAFFRAAFEDIFELNQPMVDLIEQLHGEGRRLCLLSNTNGIHVPYFEARYPIFQRFDGRIYSHEVGAMKPDSAIYRTTLERLGLDPKNTVYIDDITENVAAGESFGFSSMRYDRDDHEGFLAGLKPHLS